MASVTRNDESLAERNEVFFPNTDMIDVEPHYDNFTAIQNALRQENERKQMNITTQSIRTQFDSSSTLHHSRSNEKLDINTQHSSNTFTVPLNIQSKKIDGHIFNLTEIVENIGYDRNTPFIRSPSTSNSKNVSALLNIILKSGGAHGPIYNAWRSRVNNDYFQRWYLDKHSQRSASLIQHNASMNNINEKTTHTIRENDSVLTKLPVIDHRKPFHNEIKQVYGYDDIDGTSSVSSHSSFSDIDLKTSFYANQQQRSPSITSILKKPNHQNSPTKHHVTIREHHLTDEIKNENNKQMLTDYQQFLHQHPDLNNDTNPEIIIKPNPEQITYQQNISVRYLVPPTPPPPGPLIIREIVPPRAPSPPPLIIRHQEPPPPTPPPLIFREAPPPAPPHQETTVLTKILPSEPPSSRRVIVEHNAPLPPKPQSIIIEKWLPYKSPPPREVIYEHITEKPIISEFEPGAIDTNRQRRHSAEFQIQSSGTSIPVNHQHQRRNSVDHLESQYNMQQQSSHALKPVNHQHQRRNSVDHLESQYNIQRQSSHALIPVNHQHQQRNSVDHLESEYNIQQQSSRTLIPVCHQHQQRDSVDYLQPEYLIQQQSSGTFDELAWRTHQQILALQQRGREQVQAHQQWAANQWQQHANMYLQYPTQLATPSLVVYEQPVAMNTAAYVQMQEYRQQVQYNPTYIYPFY